MLRVETFSGSVYEVDVEGQKVRRLYNKHQVEGTERQGQDGEWRSFIQLYPPTPEVGESMVFFWGEVEVNEEEGTINVPHTSTSYVIRVDQSVPTELLN